MASLNALGSKRAGNRGAVTRLIPKIQSIIDDQTMDKDQKVHELEKKLLDLHNKIKIIENLDNEIQDVIDENDLETEINASSTANSITYDARDAAEFVLMKLKQEISNEQAAMAAAATVENPVAQAPPFIAISDSSNLPKFDLPYFDGNILLWRSFWDVFEVEVDAKTKYSDATKFNFLNSRLMGEAKALLAGLTPTNFNYPKAVDLLKQRYGQPHKIIMAHMRALVALAKPAHDRNSLRAFADNLESNIRGLEALGKGIDTYEDLLVCILLDKLSAEVRRNLTRQHGAIEWTLDDLRVALKREIVILEDRSTTNAISNHVNKRE
ncbi:uncharacterized protein LOC130701905 [Daphnia carinata]|uniref:uncharacterized protein LOC130701905 n=1 Tax=Daphnia carinata TaxID=120202 RepID=UPI0025797A5F|nr:uncharacterized protein LOC130701905 [Daphnia carinata]